jgi:hypothetical protein
MLHIDIERAHLARAERDIVEGQARIARQVELLDRLGPRSQDRKQGEALLQVFRQTLQAWQEHRDEILRTIARLESVAVEPSTGPQQG